MKGCHDISFVAGRGDPVARHAFPFVTALDDASRLAEVDVTDDDTREDGSRTLIMTACPTEIETSYIYQSNH